MAAPMLAAGSAGTGFASHLGYKFGCSIMVQAAAVAHAPEPSASGTAAAAWITKLPAPLAGRAAGPLAGLSFAVKDNIDVAGLPTTAACPGFAYRPGAHASVVRQLLEAGARLEGKTNLDQFAC